MGQVRGRRRGGRQSLVQTACGHVIVARAVRVAQSADEWYRNAGHGGRWSGGGGRSGVRQYGEPRPVAGWVARSGARRVAATAPASARAGA